MKKKNLLVAGGLFLVLSAGSYTGYAQTQMGAVSSIHLPSKVHFIKMEDDKLVFDLKLNDLPASGCILLIRDETGTIIFEERLYGDTYNKRYKIERNGMSAIHFEVFNKRVLLKESFNLHYRVEEKMEVTKAR